MNETSFMDEDSFLERVLELIKNEKEFKFYVNDKSKDAPKLFESSYKYECGHSFLFTEFAGNWSQVMLWEDAYGNPITLDVIKEHLLSFISDHTLQERIYYLEEL